MNFKEFLATLSAALPKSLSEAKLLLGQASTHFTALLADFDAKVAAHAADQQALTEARATLATVQAELTTATVRVTELTSEIAAVHTGALATLASAGITADKFDADSIKAAAAARAETLGHELLAARGMKPLPEVVNSGEVEAKLSTDAEILAAYEAMPAGPVRLAFLDKHKAAIWAAHSAR